MDWFVQVSELRGNQRPMMGTTSRMVLCVTLLMGMCAMQSRSEAQDGKAVSRLPMRGFPESMGPHRLPNVPGITPRWNPTIINPGAAPAAPSAPNSFNTLVPQTTDSAIGAPGPRYRGPVSPGTFVPLGTQPPLTTPRELQVNTDPIESTLSARQAKMAEEVEAARVLAIVGDRPILAGDLLGQINEMLAKSGVESITPEQREQLIQRFLPNLIDAKLVYLHYLQQVPPDKMEEVDSRLRDAFDQDQLTKSIEKAGVRTPGELDAKLRSLGSSLEKQQRQFGETILAQQVLREKVDGTVDVTRDDLLKYYEDNIDQYTIQEAVRWQQLTARFDAYPSRVEARRQIAMMGNDVYQGQDWVAVAKNRSTGLNAEQGGAYDWTARGSLVSKPLDQAIFSLPEGEMSEIIEDDTGFHIIRIIERREAGNVAFTEVQPKIRKKLLKDRIEVRRREFLDELREETFIWTAFDEPADTALR